MASWRTCRRKPLSFQQPGVQKAPVVSGKSWRGAPDGSQGCRAGPPPSGGGQAALARPAAPLRNLVRPPSPALPNWPSGGSLEDPAMVPTQYSQSQPSTFAERFPGELVNPSFQRFPSSQPRETPFDPYHGSQVTSQPASQGTAFCNTSQPQVHETPGQPSYLDLPRPLSTVLPPMSGRPPNSQLPQRHHVNLAIQGTPTVFKPSPSPAAAKLLTHVSYVSTQEDTSKQILATVTQLQGTVTEIHADRHHFTALETRIVELKDDVHALKTILTNMQTTLSTPTPAAAIRSTREQATLTDAYIRQIPLAVPLEGSITQHEPEALPPHQGAPDHLRPFCRGAAVQHPRKMSGAAQIHCLPYNPYLGDPCPPAPPNHTMRNPNTHGAGPAQRQQPLANALCISADNCHETADPTGSPSYAKQTARGFQETFCSTSQTSSPENSAEPRSFKQATGVCGSPVPHTSHIQGMAERMCNPGIAAGQARHPHAPDQEGKYGCVSRCQGAGKGLAVGTGSPVAHSLRSSKRRTPHASSAENKQHFQCRKLPTKKQVKPLKPLGEAKPQLMAQPAAMYRPFASSFFGSVLPAADANEPVLPAIDDDALRRQVEARLRRHRMKNLAL